VQYPAQSFCGYDIQFLLVVARISFVVEEKWTLITCGPLVSNSMAYTGAVGWIDKDAPISDLGRQRQFVLLRAEKTL
jgi:hypothetical protein